MTSDLKIIKCETKVQLKTLVLKNKNADENVLSLVSGTNSFHGSRIWFLTANLKD